MKSQINNFKDYYGDSFALYPNLNGESSEIQTKNFAKYYEMLNHCPNTESGFSATLFQNRESKEYALLSLVKAL